ncbi:primase [Dinoroseobacter phage vB_DshS-R5C]|uniref:Primase n=1 Tax=Dinoroseobacter phage vB_DshS-R5C TaxID=1965368 RepID=A0A1V0DYC0_9CAUD|nr:primase [Dinoroseobacter phage vB_DshS-R5C]ARB06130.1 primase [Dinoroseobacter phage vB_DshS-R5C]
MNNAERFERLFDGYRKRFGRYDLAGRKSAKGKEEGKATTVDQELTSDLYGKHIEGEVGIGVIPLRADNTVHFAAIDVDVYSEEDREKRKLTHEDVASAVADSPLIVTRSKSNGVHVWLFMKNAVPAQIAIEYLQGVAARLGVAGTELFPKQVARANEGDVGNWINLPYFGGGRVAVIPERTEAGTDRYIEPDLEQFLEIAEAAAIDATEEWLVANTEAVNTDKQDEEAELFFDGPPCLQTLLAGWPNRRASIERKFKEGAISEDQYKKQMAYTYPQLEEGNRDNTFLNVGHYIRRRIMKFNTDAEMSKSEKELLLEELRRAHDVWGMNKYGNDWLDPAFKRKYGIEGDLPRIANQASKGKWGYACTKEPLVGFCNRRLCVKRKFGVGTSMADMPELSEFTIVSSEDRQYYVTCHNAMGQPTRVYIPDVETLYSQTKFSQAITNQTDMFWRTMPAPKYQELIEGMMKDANENRRIVPPPADSDRRQILISALEEFIENKKLPAGKNDSAIQSGRVIMAENELEAYFKLQHFINFLRTKGIGFPQPIIAKMLTEDFNLTYKTKQFANRRVRVYVANMEQLEILSTEGFEDDGEA